MNTEECQDHHHLIRQSLRMHFCRHVVTSAGGVHEWHRVRMKLTLIQRLMAHLVMASVIGLFTWNHSALYRCICLVVIALLVELVLRFYARGKERDLAITLDASAGLLHAPLAGLEIEASHLTGFALRVVRQWARRRNQINRHPMDYMCFYARLADGSFMPLVADSLQQAHISGFETAARRFAEAVALPLIEPEPHHQPTELNPSP